MRLTQKPSSILFCSMILNVHISLPMNAHAEYSLNTLSVRELCIISDEHSSNVIPVQKEFDRRGIKADCSGIKAQKSYQHLNRQAYLKQSEIDRKLVENLSDGETFEKMSTADLCLAYRYLVGTPEKLMDELIDRDLSPAICKDIVDKAIREICEGFVSESGDLSFADARSRRQINDNLEKQLAQYGYAKQQCESLADGSSGNGVMREEVYNIDLLRITTVSVDDSRCSSGAFQKLTIEGTIGPDSSFAMSRLLDRMESCVSSNGEVVAPVTVSLRSGGGLLSHGYLMGELFREKSITTVVENKQACASSCAVAFLGGVKRIVEDDGVVMYHAPYFNGKSEYGQRDVDCNVGEATLSELKDYYLRMTDKDISERLFERTMWYCSAENGWVVKGGSAAELYGIATEK